MEKIALVTGGSSGIGLELVRQLSSRGLQILTCGRRPEPPELLRSRENVTYVACDLGTEAGLRQLLEAVGETGERLDFLYNNAGIQVECALGPELERARVEEEIALNLTTPILLTSALLPAIERAKGCVVNLSSGLAYSPKAASPVYCATKAGLSSFSRTLRYQVEARGVRVVDVVTPLVKTPMTEGRHGGAIEPEAFVEQLLAGIDAGRDEVWVGKARLLRLVSRIAPGFARGLLRNS